jgi:hypothetical protein
MKYVEKLCRAGQATDDTKQEHFTLGTYGYKHTLPEYVIFTAFPLQQWLHERASMLRYTHNAILLRISHPCNRELRSSGL